MLRCTSPETEVHADSSMIKHQPQESCEKRREEKRTEIKERKNYCPVFPTLFTSLSWVLSTCWQLNDKTSNSRKLWEEKRTEIEERKSYCSIFPTFFTFLSCWQLNDITSSSGKLWEENWSSRKKSPIFPTFFTFLSWMLSACWQLNDKESS